MSQRTNLAFRYVEPSRFSIYLFMHSFFAFSYFRLPSAQIFLRQKLTRLLLRERICVLFEEITNSAGKPRFGLSATKRARIYREILPSQNATVPKVPQVTLQVGKYKLHRVLKETSRFPSFPPLAPCHPDKQTYLFDLLESERTLSPLAFSLHDRETLGYRSIRDKCGFMRTHITGLAFRA